MKTILLIFLPAICFAQSTHHHDRKGNKPLQMWERINRVGYANMLIVDSLKTKLFSDMCILLELENSENGYQDACCNGKWEEYLSLAKREDQLRKSDTVIISRLAKLGHHNQYEIYTQSEIDRFHYLADRLK